MQEDGGRKEGERYVCVPPLVELEIEVSVLYRIVITGTCTCTTCCPIPKSLLFASRLDVHMYMYFGYRIVLLCRPSEDVTEQSTLPTPSTRPTTSKVDCVD